MDDSRFDALTKAMAAGTSRRVVIKRLGKGLGGALVGAAVLRRGAGASAPSGGGFGAHCVSNNPGRGRSCDSPFVCNTGNGASGTCGCPDNLTFCAETGDCFDASAAGACCSATDCIPNQCQTNPTCAQDHTCNFDTVTCEAADICSPAPTCNPESGCPTASTACTANGHTFCWPENTGKATECKANINACS